MGKLATTALKGVGVLLLAFIFLSALATIVGLALSIVATVVSIVVSLLVLAGIVLAAGWLFSLAVGSSKETTRDRQTGEGVDDRDPEKRLREMYIAGEIDDREFERQLDLLLDSEDTTAALNRLERENDRSRRDLLRE